MTQSKVLGKCSCGGDIKIVIRYRPKTLEEGAIIGGAFINPTPDEEAISRNIRALNNIACRVPVCEKCGKVYDLRILLGKMVKD